MHTGSNHRVDYRVAPGCEAGTSASTIPAMQPTQVTLELDWSNGRIAGLIGLASLPAQPFSGYVELMAALERTRPRPAGADGASQANG